tara:strand:- start:1537 stop:2025 length:489 start_codon:yes stop_codon:yes gene_type:complete
VKKKKKEKKKKKRNRKKIILFKFTYPEYCMEEPSDIRRPPPLSLVASVAGRELSELLRLSDGVRRCCLRFPSTLWCEDDLEEREDVDEEEDEEMEEGEEEEEEAPGIGGKASFGNSSTFVFVPSFTIFPLVLDEAEEEEEEEEGEREEAGGELVEERAETSA